MSSVEVRRKLLIVERKLIANRGHHHTQISALQTLLPNYETQLVAGETYDDFLGIAAGRLNTKSVKLAKMRARLQYGNIFERVGAAFGAIKSAPGFKLPRSAFGAQLTQICRSLQLGPSDAVVVPTAELDAFESAIEMKDALAATAPVICLRFLNSELGERSEKIRAKRLRAAIKNRKSNIHLFTETEELASYFAEEFAMPVVGGFYLTCGLPASTLAKEAIRQSDRFRIGVFGEPRPEKGSGRITGIVAALSDLAKAGSVPPLEVLIQGSSEDFRDGGVFAPLQKIQEEKKNISVSPQSSRISPEEFERLFHSVDAILLPYDKAVYSLQGSGVIQDAVAAQKAVIYTRGMSMSAFLCHGNGFPATTDREFAEAILEVAADPSSVHQGTARAAKYFQNLLLDNALLGVLTGAGGQAEGSARKDLPKAQRR
jgi:hypothetical protein